MHDEEHRALDEQRAQRASTSASVCTSSADNGSSSTSTRGRPMMARAKRQPLALPARERQALLADAGLEPPRQVEREAGLRDAQRVGELVVGRVGLAHQQVLAHRRREQRRLFEREPDVGGAGW